MQLTHLGHAGLLVEAADRRILIDPGVFSRLDAIGDVNAVIVTHQHPDHLDPNALRGVLERSPDAAVYADPQSAKLLAAEGISATETVQGQNFTVGEVEVSPVGRQHAVNSEYVERVDNVGVVLRAPGEPSLFHPGDALDAEPGEVDFLGVPLNAPWCAVKETLEFVRRIKPRAVVPIHDSLLSEAGRGAYLMHVQNFGLDGGVEVRDLVDGAPASLE